MRLMEYKYMSPRKIFEKFHRSLRLNLLSETKPQSHHEWINALELGPEEYVYIIDYREKDIVAHRGIDVVMGYDKRKISINYLAENIEEDHLAEVNLIADARLEIASEYILETMANSLSISYQAFKANGNRVSILRRSYFKMQHEGTGFPIVQISRCQVFSPHSGLFPDFKPRFEISSFNGLPNLDDKIRAKFMEVKKPPFSEAEMAVVRCCGMGYRPAKIAVLLKLSVETVRKHLNNMKKKSPIKIGSQVDLVNYCVAEGYIRPGY